MINVTSSEDFYKALDETNEAVVLFTAPSWCVPCQRFAPHFAAVAATTDDITFVKVDIDEADSELQAMVQSVPTVVYHRNGDGVAVDLRQRTAAALLGEIANARTSG